MILSAIAPAKINLFLHVTGRRADGYHLLQSLMVPLSYGDIIHAAPADDVSLTLVDAYGADALREVPEEENLMLKAVHLLKEVLGEERGIRLTLEKRLPVASGMGGGSSDAATTLRLCLAVWQQEMPEETLFALALSLGADIPFFLAQSPVHVEGIGEILKPVSVPSMAVLLINPGIAVSTREIFTKGFDVVSFPVALPEDYGKPEAFIEALKSRRNDLEKNACELVPEIAELLEALEEMPGVLLSRMTGSGATCFALFSRDEEAEDAADILTRRFPDAWIKASRFAES